MDVRLLGQLEVDDGERVRIEAPKQRAVLEALAIFADVDVSPDTLIDAIWGDSPPPTAGKSLHSHVSRLRSVLPEGVIVTDGQAYRLDIDPDDVDVHRFERLVRRRRAKPSMATNRLDRSNSSTRRSTCGVVDPSRTSPMVPSGLVTSPGSTSCCRRHVSSGWRHCSGWAATSRRSSTPTN